MAGGSAAESDSPSQRNESDHNSGGKQPLYHFLSAFSANKPGTIPEVAQLFYCSGASAKRPSIDVTNRLAAQGWLASDSLGASQKRHYNADLRLTRQGEPENIRPCSAHCLKWFLRILLILVVALAIFLINLIWFRPWSLNLFYEKVFAQVLFEEPELLSALGLVEQFGFTAHNGKLNDESPAHQQRQFDRLKHDLADLQAYSIDRQTPSQRLSTRILGWFLEREAEGEKYQWHNYPVNQLFGVQNEFPSFMANTHRLLKPRDCDYYLQRLDAVSRKFDQLLVSLRMREEKKILPPRFVVEEVLKEMRDFVAQPPAENILSTSFKTRAAKINELDDAQRANFQSQVEAAVQNRVYPAYQKLIDYFNQLLPQTTTDDGVWKLPDGDAFYAYMLRKNTTTQMAPAEVHDLGVREVARIEAEMRTILDANGFKDQPVGTAMNALGKDPRFLFSNDEKGRADALAEYTQLITDAIEHSKALFQTVPKAKIEVRRVPEFKEATSAGAYYQGAAMDGTRPGVFFANLRDMNEVAKWGMPTLAYHEGVPGHHWQISTAQEIHGVPQFRKLIPFTAYGEGWALYAEWLAHEAGWYRRQSIWRPGSFTGRAFPGGPSRGRHRDSRETLDPATGDRLHARQNWDGRKGRHVGDRTLHCDARPGVLV